MKNIRSILLTCIALLGLFLFLFNADGGPHNHENQQVNEEYANETGHPNDEHDDHKDQQSHVEDEGQNEIDEHDDHAGHAEEGHQHGAEEAPGLSNINSETIQFAIAEPGVLKRQISLPGEIKINTDQMAHIVPRVPGVVRQVFKRAGDRVKKGEVLAYIESTEVGTAKVEYLSKKTELGCCAILLTRAQEIHDNTLRLIDFLHGEPSMEEIRNYDSSGSGAYWGKLVSAYAEYVFAKSAYEREKSLSDQKITSENDFLSAVNNLKQAEANYLAALDESLFEVTRDLLEAQQQQQVGTLELKNAERTLYVLGLSESDIEGLDHLSTTTGDPKTEHECNDPNCTDCSNHQQSDLEHSRASANSHSDGHECNDPDCTDCINHKEKEAHGESHVFTGHDEQTLALYPLRAPFDGTIVEKHITLGEKLGDDDNAFTIVDLSSVWVDFSIFAKELDSVHLGELVHLSTANSNQEATGEIDYLAPVIDRETRTALGRATIENTDGKWRPGLFVTVDILKDEIPVPIAIPKDTVQNIENEAVVFVRHEGDIEPRPVHIGREDSSTVEILSGLSPGDEYVSGNSFSLKAEIITSGLDPHAGHGH